MQLYFLNVVILVVLVHLCQGSVDSYSIPGCSKHCPSGSTKNALPINGYVLDDVLRMPFNRLCESLKIQDLKPKYPRNSTQPNPAFPKIQNQPTQKICQTLFEDVLNKSRENHDHLHLVLRKIQRLSPARICNTFAPENSRKMRQLDFDSECTQVCPAGNEVEKKKIRGAFLENLRRDSLRKICKNLLITHAKKMAADAKSSTKWTKLEVKQPRRSLKSAAREIKLILNKEKRLSKSQIKHREKLNKAMRKLKATKSDTDAIFAKMDVDWAMENLSSNEEEIKEVRKRMNEVKMQTFAITKKLRLAEVKANEAEKKAIEVGNKTKHVLESLKRVD